MSQIVVPSVSREFVYVPDVKAFFDGTETDPTILGCAFAFMREGRKPSGSDWKNGEWAENTDTPTARILVGLAPVVLTAGKYDVWLRITGANEIPARPVGKLLVT